MANPDEMFDVVNERNEVIGQAKRGDVHRDGLWHRAARILIFNSEGELLLQRRNKDADINPGVWSSSAAGHLDVGEDYSHAARRELKEELGIEIKLSEIGSEKIDTPNDRTFARYYAGKYDGKFRIQKEELSEATFFPIEKVKAMIKENPKDFSPNFLKLFEFFMKNGGMQHAKR